MHCEAKDLIALFALWSAPSLQQFVLAMMDIGQCAASRSMLGLNTLQRAMSCHFVSTATLLAADGLS
jgi:hypothetical protein